MLYPYLPFPRGGTMSDWNAHSNVRTALTSSTWLSLAGQKFWTSDTVHETGRPIGLIVLKNGAAAITVARKFLKFSVASALDFGRVSGGYNDAAGGIVVALDDKYTVGKSIPAYDLFYGLFFGPCTLTTEASSVNLSAGDAVASDGSGFVNGAAAAAGEFVAGTADVASTTTGESIVIHMDADFAKPPAAG